MTKLELKAVVQRYGRQTIVNGVDFRLEQGRIACLLGPSGCGKTTLLRCIAGFEDVSGGEILIHDEVMSRPGLRLPPEQRQVGMVFQDYALFPHLSVERNVGFGLGGMSAAARFQRVDQLLATVGLGGQGSKFPHELSGGTRRPGRLITASWIRISPPETSSNPAMQRSKVVLPQPDGPSRQAMRPCSRRKSTPLTMV